jgi:hypothetical protein
MTAAFNTWIPIAGCTNSTDSTGNGGTPPPAQQFLSFRMEPLAVTALNTLAPLNFPATGDLLLLIVNGQTFTPADSSFSLTVDGQHITWMSTIYSLVLGADVVAVYSYLAG